MSSEHLSSEDEILDRARVLRLEVEQELRTTEGKLPVQDPKAMGLYLQNLDGLERAALAKKRISSDEKVGGAQAAAAAMLAEALRSPQATQIGRMGGARADVPVLDADIAPTRVLDNELTNGDSGDSYESFMNRNQQFNQGADA